MLPQTTFPTLLAALLLPFTSSSSSTAKSPTLTLHIPTHIPALPPTTHALLTTHNITHRAPITRLNTFVFTNLLPPSPSSSDPGRDTISYLLDIACRDYDFATYGMDVRADGKVEAYRVGRGGVDMGGREVVGEGGLEVRVLRAREYYEGRAGFSPLSLLKNPMILIAVVGLAFVIGMPYLMDSMDPDMRKEFEEQQKKSVLRGGASTANPLQNFDMAAWMAGKTAGTSGSERAVDDGDKGAGGGSGSGSATGGGSGSGSKARRRG